MRRLIAFVTLVVAASCHNSGPEWRAIQAIKNTLNSAHNRSTALETRRDENARALKSILTLKNNLEKRKLLSNISANSWYLQDLPSLDRASTNLKRLSIAVKDSTTLSQAVHYRGLLYRDSDPDSSFVYFQQSYQIDKKLDNQSGQAKNLIDLAELQLKFGDYPGCESKIRSALKYLKESDNTGYLYFRCYEILGLMYYELAEIPECTKYFNIALATARSEDFPNQKRTVAIILNDLGNCFYKQRQYKKAIYYYQKALILSAEIKNNRLYAILLDNIALAHYSTNNKELAANYFFRSKSINTQIGNIDGIIKTSLSIAQYYREKGDRERELIHVQVANDFAFRYGIVRAQLQPLVYLAHLYPQNASEIARQYVHLRDAITLADRQVRNRFARREFNTDVLEEERGDAKINAYYFVGVAAVMLIGGFLLFSIMKQRLNQKKLLIVQRQKKASNDIYRLMDERRHAVRSAQKNEKHRISNELRDSIVIKLKQARKNLLVIETKTDPETILRCLKYLDDIQDLEKELRLVAHDLVEDRFSEHDNFNVIIRTMLDEESTGTGAKTYLNVSYEVDWSTIRGPLKVNLFKILKQAARHAIRFGKARNLYVNVEIDIDMLQSTIHDDGSQNNPRKRRTNAMLNELSPTLDSVSGTLDILSQPGNGTTIIVNLPLKIS